MKFLKHSLYLVLLLSFSPIFSMEKEQKSILSQFITIQNLEDIILDYSNQWYVEKNIEHYGPISAVAISADSSMFVTAYRNVIKLWNYRTLTNIKNITLPKELRLPGMMPMEINYEVNHKNSASLRDFEKLLKDAIEPNIKAVTISRDNKYLAFALDNQCIEIREIETEKRLRQLLYVPSSENYRVPFLSFSPDNRFLSICSFDNVARNYELLICNLTENKTNILQKVEVIKELPNFDDETYKGFYETTNDLWNILMGNSLVALIFPPSAEICAFDNEKLIGSGGPNPQTILIIYLDQAKKYLLSNKLLTYEEKAKLSEKNKSIRLFIRDLEDITKKYHQEIDFNKFMIRELKEHTDRITSLACAPNGHYILSGSQDNTVKIWRNQKHVMLGSIIYNNYKSINLNTDSSFCRIL